MELLAPAGNWESFMAAVKNGADAVYMGGEHYSARQSAQNFTIDEIHKAVDYAHIRDKKVYLTVNTLIDNKEFPDLLEYIYNLQKIGVDALIVQDLGLMGILTRVFPDLRLHASTQMTVHNQAGVAFLRKEGIKRVVLAREMSLTDLEIIGKEIDDIEIEVFVHGAICYCYSGQCLFSSMAGGRSGNRGRCAQPCRLPYELYSKNTKRKIELHNKGRYLLSPADLCLIEYLPELKRAGVTSLKIEGRMKRPEYVAVVSRAYREALDILKTDPGFRPEQEVKNRMLKIFNRNFSTGHFLPVYQDFLSSNRPNNRGVYAGRVIEQKQDMTCSIKLADSVSLGDGLVIWVGKGKGPVLTVKEIYVNGKKVKEASKGEVICLKLDSKVYPHDRVFKTHDERIVSSASESIKNEDPKNINIIAYVYLEEGKPLCLKLQDEEGHEVEYQSRNIAEKASKYPLDEKVLREKIDRLGNTPFNLKELIISGDKNLMIPFSDINETRREAVDLLLKKVMEKYRHKIVDRETYQKRLDIIINTLAKKPRKAQLKLPLLTVMVSNSEQARAAINSGADCVYLGMEGLISHRKLHNKEISNLIDLAEEKHCKLIPSLPRISKPSDENIMAEIAEIEVPVVMISNLGDMKKAVEHNLKFVADYSFNVFNKYTLKFLKDRGANTICLSPELNFTQLQEFDNFDKVEMLIHGEIMVMQSQYCLLKGLLGSEHESCPAFCQKDDYYLRDDKGYEFPLESDAYCRQYIFNSRTLCLIEDISRLLTLNPAALRIEARRLNPEQIKTTVFIYREALREYASGLKTDLRAYKNNLLKASNSEFTKCHYYRGVLKD